MSTSKAQNLTKEDRIEVFRIATRTLAHWYSKEIKSGMTDAILTYALERALGSYGGSSGPNILSEVHMGRGLRIWGGWSYPNHTNGKPLFSGTRTVAMARMLYNIPDPDNDQLVLF